MFLSTHCRDAPSTSHLVVILSRPDLPDKLHVIVTGDLVAMGDHGNLVPTSEWDAFGLNSQGRVAAQGCL